MKKRVRKIKKEREEGRRRNWRMNLYDEWLFSKSGQISKRRTCDDEDEKMLERYSSKRKSTKSFRWERTGKESMERNGKIKIDLLWPFTHDDESCQDRIRDVCSYILCIWWWRTTMKPPKSTNDPWVGDDSIMEMKFSGQNKSFDRVGSTYDPWMKSVRKAHSEVVKQLCRLYY